MFMIGNVSNKARELVQTCQDALNAAISICAPGVPISEIGKVIESVAKPHGFSIVRDFCGHGIGKVMHDNPNILHFYDKSYDKLIMQPGFVFTIEPMINTGTYQCEIDKNDGWTVRTKDGGLSAQWEHTLGITEDGVIIFTEKMLND
jgi:methionyl aminopeptidase